jgi:hypothetical protein
MAFGTLARGQSRAGRKGDRVYTPPHVARDMVRHFYPCGRILEPCRGDGAIYDLLPDGAQFCEIDEGLDFFDWSESVDWIITNPPYSKMRPFMVHAFGVAENIVLLIPVRNLVSGYGTVREAVTYGFGVKEIRWYGGGARLGFPMGNAIAAVHWRKRYAGDTRQSFFEDETEAGRRLCNKGELPCRY